MSEKNFGYLGTTFQQSLLKAIIEDKKFAVTIIDVIDSKYFDGPYFKYLMENLKELYTEYGYVPNYETLQQKILSENVNTTAKVHLDTLNSIKDKEFDGEALYVKKTALNFCRQQVLKRALKESEEIMSNGDFEEYDKIEGKIQTALQVGVTNEDMVDIGDNVLDALEDDYRVPFPTGIVGIDNLLKGGIARGEMALLLAPTGIGKTTWLTMMANSAYVAGANVLHIFFEDNMNDIRRKHYTIWTGVAPDELPKQKEFVKEFIHEKVSKNKNFLKLAKYPSGDLSISEIKNKIRKLASEGHKIDLLVLDYVDCISGEATMTGDEWKGEGAIMRSLEGMTDEFNIAIWTATQGNRDSIVTEVVTTNQMGGSIKKAQIGHVVISIGKTLEQKENNLATVTLLKSRIGKDGIVFQNCLFNNETLQVNTDTQNTLLGHKTERAEQLEQHRIDVYQAFVERKREIERAAKERNDDIQPQTEFDKKEVEDTDINDVVKKTSSVPVIERDNPTEAMTPQQRAAQVYKERKQKELESVES
ncbi:MAG TPA: DnaB family ATPase [Candidatus Glassbacteria bacterium]|nr:DnaB family ATPase [Candidatus Glassbacteria bacterium]